MSVLLPFSILGAPGDDALDVADVFSTDLYTGNGATQSITNGVDLSGQGGLVWIKDRDNANNHRLHDSGQAGVNYSLSSNLTSASGTVANSISSFNADGYTIGSNSTYNGSGQDFVGWTFRRAPKFFDVVTYTGDGANASGFSAKNISHNLGSVPGAIIIKRTDTTEEWLGGFKNGTNYQALSLNETSASSGANGITLSANDSTFNSGEITNAAQTIGGNKNGATYVAYLFAHDTSDTGIIQCGSYTGNGSASGPTVTLGWEPQWLLVKRASNVEAWYLFDNQRSAGATWDDSLRPNGTNIENVGSALIRVDVSSTGFAPASSDTSVNNSGDTYIYMAIRAEGA